MVYRENLCLCTCKPLYAMAGTTKYQESLPDLPKVLFWDIPGQVPDYKNHPEGLLKGCLIGEAWKILLKLFFSMEKKR